MHATVHIWNHRTTQESVFSSHHVGPGESNLGHQVWLQGKILLSWPNNRSYVLSFLQIEKVLETSRRIIKTLRHPLVWESSASAPQQLNGPSALPSYATSSSYSEEGMVYLQNDAPGAHQMFRPPR